MRDFNWGCLAFALAVAIFWYAMYWLGVFDALAWLVLWTYRAAFIFPLAAWA